MARLVTWIGVVACAVAVSGCGSPAQVTYVDPNGPDDGVSAGSGGAPLERHGSAALERARSCIGVRGALAVARTLSSSDPSAASHVLAATVRDDLPVIEPRASATVPTLARSLRSSIEQLRDRPPADPASYAARVRTISDAQLRPSCDAAVPIEARQDQSFRAAMLATTLEDAAAAYEEAFIDDPSSPSLAAYRRAYGLLVDASTRQLEAVPQDSRPRIRATLERIMRRATPSPTPPEQAPDAERVVGELSALMDDVALAARIDTTTAEPDTATTDHLRTLKRGLAAAVEAAERGDGDAAIARLRALDASALVPAASGIASVSPGLLAELENDLLLRLPAAIRSGEDVAALASEVDARIDEATSLVEEELELLRGS